MIELLSYLIPTLVYILIGVFSLYLYFRVRKGGFFIVGISFLVATVPSLVRLALGGPYLVTMLLDKGLSVREISEFLSILGLIEMGIIVVFAVLVLVGLVFLAKDVRAKQ